MRITPALTATAVLLTALLAGCADRPGPAVPYGCSQVTAQLKTFSTAIGKTSAAGDTISGVGLIAGMITELRRDLADPKVQHPLATQELALADGLQKMTGDNYQAPITAIKGMCGS